MMPPPRALRLFSSPPLSTPAVSFFDADFADTPIISCLL